MSLSTFAYAISFLAALGYFALMGAPPSLMKAFVKALAVGGLFVAALSFGAPWPLLVGLLLSIIGDVALSFEGDQHFIVGLGAFLLAHIFYAYGFWIGFNPFAETGSTLNIIIFAVILAVMIIFGVSRIWPYLGKMALPVSAYIVVILVMNIAALLFAPQWTKIGALTFALSDMLLAIGLFAPFTNPALVQASHYAVWGLYVVAQWLIISPFKGKAILLGTLLKQSGG